MRRCAAPQCSRAARAVAGLTRVLLQRSVEQHLEQRSDPNGMHMAHAVDGPWAAWAHVNVGDFLLAIAHHASDFRLKKFE